MKQFTSKQYNISALVAGAVVVFFTVMLGLFSVLGINGLGVIGGISQGINTLLPVLIIFVAAALFLGNRERAFESKWSIVSGVLFFLIGIGYFYEVIVAIFYSEAYYTEPSFISYITSAFGLLFSVGIVLAILKKNIFRLTAQISFGILAASSVLSLIDGMGYGLFHVSAMITSILFVVILADLPEVAKKILRTIAVVFVILSFTTGYNPIFSAALLIFALLLVPAKVRVTLSFITGVLFAVVAFFELSALMQAAEVFEVISSLFCIAAAVLFAIYFFSKRKPGIGICAVAVFIVSLIIRNFAGAGLFSFIMVEYLLGIGCIAGICAAILLAKVMTDPGNEKNPRLRLYIILLSVLMAVPNLSTIEYFYAMEIMMISACVLAAAMILASFVLVPFKFTKYQGIAKHIFLSMFTLGVWQMIWIYNVTKNFNEETTEKRKPVCELLLSIFLPFYAFYWTYKTALIAEKYGNVHGIEKKDATLTFLLYFVGGVLVPSILIQNKINEIEGK